MNNFNFYEPFMNSDGEWLIYFPTNASGRKIRKKCEAFIRKKRKKGVEVWPTNLCNENEKIVIKFMALKKKGLNKKWNKISFFRCIGLEENQAEAHERLKHQIKRWIGKNYELTLLSPQRKLVGSNKILLIFVATKCKTKK